MGQGALKTGRSDKTGVTRQRLLEAGLKLISARGYLGATTKEIAKKAGVAELTLFRHFPSKELLFREIIQSYTFLPALKGLLPELKGVGYREALLLIAGRFLGRLSERRDLIRIMNSEMHLYPRKVKDIYQNFIGGVYRTLASYFKDLQDRGLLREFDPEYGARAFLGMFFAYFTVRELLRENSSNEEEIINEFVEIFIRGTTR
ncbi:MAG: TetR/AcrR family transcriptional regulator [Nitrospiraceae bacterium]|nr:TetR/AcrR family transcriptional regulator [Nitrospiraceae bacterium]